MTSQNLAQMDAGILISTLLIPPFGTRDVKWTPTSSPGMLPPWAVYFINELSALQPSEHRDAYLRLRQRLAHAAQHTSMREMVRRLRLRDDESLETIVTTAFQEVTSAAMARLSAVSASCTSMLRSLLCGAQLADN